MKMELPCRRKRETTEKIHGVVMKVMQRVGVIEEEARNRVR